jgi:hypothetical protein
MKARRLCFRVLKAMQYGGYASPNFLLYKKIHFFQLLRLTAVVAKPRPVFNR